jgi:hypothetical protein
MSVERRRLTRTFRPRSGQTGEIPGPTIWSHKSGTRLAVAVQ